MRILKLQISLLMQKASNVTNKTPWKGANNNLDFGDCWTFSLGRNI